MFFFYPKHVNSNKYTASAGATSSVLVKDLGWAIKLVILYEKREEVEDKEKELVVFWRITMLVFHIWSNPERGEC